MLVPLGRYWRSKRLVFPRGAWEKFVVRAGGSNRRQWSRYIEKVDDVTWYAEIPEPGAWFRVTDLGIGRITLWSKGCDLLGEVTTNINQDRRGVLYARRLTDTIGVELRYRWCNV